MSLIQRNQQLKATRDGFGEAILELAADNENIVALSANLAESTRLDQFIEKYPERYIEVGVAEQNLASVAVGLALSGKIPFITSFAAFSPGCNWQQIRTGICYNNANVKIVSTHAGITVGADGAMHQSLEDIAIMRVLPNMTIISPCDFIETKKAIIAAANHKGPVYIRLGREPVPNITVQDTIFEIGKCIKLKEGSGVTIVATGILVYQAILAAEQLEKEGISVEVINCHTIKPLDGETILASVKKTGHIIVAEEHQKAGGLSGAIAEFLSEQLPTPMISVGINNTFGESGKADELMSKYKVDAPAIIEDVKNVLKK